MKKPQSAILILLTLAFLCSCSDLFDPTRDAGIPWSMGSVTFGLFSESVPVSVIWDTDTKLDIWQGIDLSEQSSTVQYGMKAWKITSTLNSWIGMGLRVEPISTNRDLSSFDGGKLHLSFKGTKPFKVGIQDGVRPAVWIPPTLMFAYGLQTNDSWCEINIPLSAFVYTDPFFDSTKIQQFFMFGVDAAVSGDVFYIDEVYWSKDYYGITDHYIPTNFGIYSDSVDISVDWANSCSLDLWTEYFAGETLTNVQANAFEGLNCWELTGTGSWMGMGIRVNPVSAYKDMSEYALGALHFSVKGTNMFNVGIQSGANTKVWVVYNQLTNLGYLPDGNWHEIVIPMTNHFTGIDFTHICQYFMFVSDGSSYTNGIGFSLDHIYWSLTN